MKPFVLVKQIAIVTAIALIIIMLASCGGGSTANPSTVTGNWTITLYNTSNVASYVITTSLNQQVASPSVSSPVTGSNLALTADPSANGCFAADSSAKQTGVFTVNDNFQGMTINTLQLTIQGSTGTITLRGPFATTGISGPWQLQTTVPNCTLSSSGTFMMTRA